MQLELIDRHFSRELVRRQSPSTSWLSSTNSKNKVFGIQIWENISTATGIWDFDTLPLLRSISTNIYQKFHITQKLEIIGEMVLFSRLHLGSVIFTQELPFFPFVPLVRNRPRAYAHLRLSKGTCLKPTRDFSIGQLGKHLFYYFCVWASGRDYFEENVSPLFPFVFPVFLKCFLILLEKRRENKKTFSSK